MSSLAVPPPTVSVPVWGGGLVIWLHLDTPAENEEYCRGIMHRPVHFLSLADGLPLPACGSAQLYRIASYFRGVLIFVIFVTRPGVTKFCTHEVFHLRYKLLVLLLR